jgi:UDP-hydrolysing UDP-N-acetyl-D-glucosamine 2-epimerase
MGESPKFVFNVGSPSIDMIYKKQIISKNNLEKKYKIKFTGNDILLIQHPITTEPEKSKNQILVLTKGILKTKQTVFAIAPNSDAGGLIIFNVLQKYSKDLHFFQLYKSIPRKDYLGMLKYGGMLIGNSSSGIIEASYFNIPVVNIGIRQDGRESGNNIINTNNSPNSITNGIKKALRFKDKQFEMNKIYGNGKASKKIVKILESISIDKRLIQKQIQYD